MLTQTVDQERVLLLVKFEFNLQVPVVIHVVEVQPFPEQSSGKGLIQRTYRNCFTQPTYLTKNAYNSLPNNNILDWTKLKAFADNKFNLAKMIIFLLDRLKKIVGKGENAGYQHCLLFQQYFQKTVSSGSLKVGIVW